MDNFGWTASAQAMRLVRRHGWVVIRGCRRCGNRAMKCCSTGQAFTNWLRANSGVDEVGGGAM